jgi:hypothetical protein
MVVPEKMMKVSDEQAMKDVMALLDEWQAPEPSPWFDARMAARFREEQQRAPEGFFARLRDRWLYRAGSPMKPLMAGAMALILVAGGTTTYLEMNHKAVPTTSATVQDLQDLDSNAQTIQQMGQLLDDDDNSQS